MSTYYYFQEEYQMDRPMRRYKELLEEMSRQVNQLVLKRNKECNSWRGTWEKAWSHFAEELQKLKRSELAQELSALKGQLDDSVRARSAEYFASASKLFMLESNQTLQEDLKLYRRDLEVLDKIVFVSHSGEGFQTGSWRLINRDMNFSSFGDDGLSEYLHTIHGENEEFLKTIILEIQGELQKRGNVDPIEQLAREQRARIEELETEKQRLAKMCCELSAKNQELKEQLEANESSRFEQLADELIDKAKNIADAEARIRKQWEGERETATDAGRRDIDRIYHGVLEQFREKL